MGVFQADGQIAVGGDAIMGSELDRALVLGCGWRVHQLANEQCGHFFYPIYGTRDI